MIAITFALRDESLDLCRALKSAPNMPRMGGEACAFAGKLGNRDAVIFLTGMGEKRVRERLPRLFELCQVDAVISAGYAGGLDPKLGAGSLVLAENFSHPALLAAAQQALGARCVTGSLAASPTALETPAEKKAFRAQTGALAVDMETAAIAELCAARGVPMLSLRVITDTATDELAAPFSVCFDAQKERPRIAALLCFLLLRPARIPAFARFVGTINRCRSALAAAVIDASRAM